MKKNFKLTIGYDGTEFFGWQKQNNTRTVQGEIEKSIGIMTREEVKLHGSGRTDSGVHSVGQIANFVVDTNISDENFLKGLNSLLPEDIIIKECSTVDLDFHSRYSAKKKSYKYRILNSETPDLFQRRYSWFIKDRLDISEMNKSAEILVGEHDFKSFESTGSPKHHTIRTIYNAYFERESNDIISFEISGNGFLKYMVRNIVGTLVDVGKNLKSKEEFENIFKSKNRNNAGVAAPSKGLFLMGVDYP